VILAAGLAPAWQQIFAFDRFQAGEVNRAADAESCASGKVINVGLALFHLGVESRTLTVVGGRAGQGIREEFAASNIPATWIETDVPTRTCTTILDRSAGVTTELVENAPPLGADALKRFASAFKRHVASADAVVITGSNPPGTPATFYRDLLRAAPARCILDIRGDELLAALETRPFVVKPNRDELAATVGRDLSSDDELLRAMRELNERGAEWAVVTDGAGPVWMTSTDATFRLQSLKVDVVNPIGCGDCLAAGIAWSIAQGASPAEWVQLGIAAAAENASQLLPARLDPQRVRSLAIRGAVC
jgi:tagatose 6-phosphate kinase